MRYPIHNLDLNQPLPTLTTSAADDGIALIFRYCDRPIGFVLHPIERGRSGQRQSLSPSMLSKLITPEINAKLLQEKIRQSLTVPPPTETFPSLTVAICTKDRPDNVRRCLSSLLAVRDAAPHQSAELAAELEILVIDNAPSDERTRQVVDSMPGVRYSCEPKPGLDFARNHAVRAARGELLAFLDDDVVVDRCWLNGLKEAWQENPSAAAFTGLVLPYEIETRAQLIFERRGGFRRGFEKIHYGQTLEGNPCYPCGAGIFGAGCNMAFRRRVLLEIGGFDDALDTGKPLPGGGDLDIFYRVIRAGYELVYAPSYAVHHQHRQTMAQLQHQYWTWGLGLMAFVVKSFRYDTGYRLKNIQLVIWWFKYQLGELLQSFYSQDALPTHMVLSELWGGIVGLCGEYSRSRRRIQKIRAQHS